MRGFELLLFLFCELVRLSLDHANLSDLNCQMLPVHEAKPLHGIRVIDFGCYLAGPLVGRILADAGATVTSVTPPNGPLWNHKHVNHALSRGKQSIPLDLKSAAGKRKAWQLVLAADVLVENFTPGTLARLGFSPDAVKRANPRCIFLSLPGFSSNDEEFKDTKAFEAVVMAQSGVYCDMGLNRKLQTAHFVSLQVI